MGISGLLPFLKNASRPVHVSELSGKVAAIDVYCWLHKGAFGCADKLVLSQKTDGYVTYVMKYVDLLLHHDIKPILVFDGRNLPSKAETEKKRRDNRAKYRKMARDYLQEGRHKEARECMQRCIDITPEMARDVIRACNERNIDCVIAPYEADAQLAYLATNGGIADFVISEDSDLTLFGCDKIVFKLDSNGNGVLYEKEKLPKCLGSSADNFTFEKFRYMCIMAGCDYLNSLPGIGIGKACKFWGKVSNPNIQQVLKRIPAYLNMPKLSVSDEYVEGFVQANQTFLYQIVFDTKTKRFRPLNDYPAKDDASLPEKLDFAGSVIDEFLQLDYALGNLDIKTLAKVGSYDPDISTADTLPPKTKYGKPVLHQKSIWDPTYDPRNGFRVQLEETEEERAKSKAATDSAAISSCFSKSSAGSVTSTTSKAPSIAPSKQKAVEASKKVNKPVSRPVTEVVCEEDIYNVPESEDGSLNRLRESETKTPTKEVFVSKYFGGGNTSSPVARIFKRSVVSPDGSLPSPSPKKIRLTMDTNQHSTPKAKRVVATLPAQKDWFDTLDDEETKDKRALVYDVTTPKQQSPVNKPFKPPVMTPPPSLPSQEKTEVRKSRNPFAKKVVSPPQQIQSVSPLKISASQLSTKAITCGDENLMFEDEVQPLSPKLTDRPQPVIDSPPPKSISSQLKSLSELSETSSTYFSAKSSSVKVSGLMKKSHNKGKQSNNKSQPSILSMFKKV